MAQFVNMRKVDLLNGEPAVFSLRQLYYADQEANKIGAIVYMGGEPYALSGTCTGTAIRADGTTVPMQGHVDGNQAYITLIPDCYAIEGSIQIFVKITIGDVVATLAAAVGTVRLTETDAVIDPGEIIPSVSALITSINDAIASIPADYSGLLAAIAPNYADLVFPVTAGTWCWHDGGLYRAAVDIQAAETWTAAHWETVPLSNSLAADVKNRVSYAAVQTLTDAQKTQARDNIGAASDEDVDGLNSITFQLNQAATFDKTLVSWARGVLGTDNNGKPKTDAKSIYTVDYFLVDPGTEIRFTGDLTNRLNTPYFYDINKNLIGTGTNTSPYSIPENAYFIRFAYRFTIASGITVDTYEGGMEQMIEDWSISCRSKLKKDIDNRVSFAETQTLTDTQKTTARSNIGAAAAEDVESLTDTVNDSIFQVVNYTASEWENGAIDARYGNTNSTSGYIRTKEYIPVDSVFKITSQDGVKFLPFCYTYANGSYSYLGWWNGSTFVAATGSSPYYSKSQYIAPIKTAGATFIRLCAVSETSGETISVNDCTKISKTIDTIGSIEADIVNIESQISDISRDNGTLTDLVAAQKAIADDWHFAFINVYDGMGLGANHLIPGTKNLWSQSATKDLDQQHVWMQDGIHPFKGTGVTDMYARTIAPQLAMVVPSYRNGVGLTTPSVWSGRNVLWMGTSIPKGSDPDAGEGQGATYPELVCGILGATATNIARGSSCLRINASTGTYDQMLFAHLLRAVTRTVAECDLLAENWSNIDKTKIVNAPETLSESDIAIMKSHSFENLLLPYLDGTHSMPDLFVIDYGHNDVRPRGVDGENDLWIEPSIELIEKGTLAEDTYMTSSSYANLKTALNNDLSGITDKAGFAASLNRNCFKGAVNFLITLILSYNPYARIVIVSDYN